MIAVFVVIAIGGVGLVTVAGALIWAELRDMARDGG